MTRADIADRKKGIGFSGTGFTPDDKATVTVVGTDGSKYSPPTKLTVDEKGKVSGTYFFSVTDNAKVPAGNYSLYLTDEKTEKDSSKVTFEVVPSDSDIDEKAQAPDCTPATGPAPEPSESTTDEPSEPATSSAPTEASPAPSESTSAPSETATSDPTETKSEEPSEKPTETKQARKPAAPKPSETKEARKSATPDPTEPKTQSPEPTETTETETETPAPTDNAEGSESASDATADDSGSTSDDGATSDEGTASESKSTESSEPAAPASPGTDDGEKKAAATATQALIIDPTEISSEDFLGEGIKLGITGAQPGEKITITVEHAQGKVDRYTMTKEADSEGKATFGVQAKVKAVLGTYNVRAQADSFDKPQGGTFTVVTNGTAVDEGGENGNSGNDLPRTGAELTGLALGAGLLVVGAAAVVITRRRMTASDDPAEF